MTLSAQPSAPAPRCTDPAFVAAAGARFATLVFAHPLLAATPACELGAFFALGQFLLLRGAQSSIARKDAERALRVRATPQPGQALEALELQGLVSFLEGGLVSLPLLTQALAEVSAESVPSSPKRVVPKKRELVVDGVTRVDMGLADTSAVVARVLLEGGIVAEITQAYVDEQQALFPKVDVLGKFRYAASWAEANPSRRKTAGGIKRYLNGWLLRDVERSDVRNAVMAADNSRQGFGNGGNYAMPTAAPTAAPAPCAATPEAAEDDFGLGDLLEAPRAAPNVTPNATPNVTPNAVSKLAPVPQAAAPGSLTERLRQQMARRKASEGTH
jgi:hypothetical protein